MKLYKILHIPTGLYFKPSKYRSKSNLSKNGKVYSTKPNLGWVNPYHHPDDVKRVGNHGVIVPRYPVDGEFKIVEYATS